MAGIEVRWQDGEGVVVRGSALPEILGLVPEGAFDLGPGLVPTAGAWTRTVGEASFAPRFALVPGTRLVALGRADDPAAPWVQLGRVEVPRAAREPQTVVAGIEPAVDTVPANLLRFAVTFSASMEEGSAARHVRLLDETGAELAGALYDMPPELWDRDRTRLTVLIEPGRIKRGLQPHEQAGAPLSEGAVVTLVVDADVRDAAGTPLLQGSRRAYRVTSPVRARVDPALWKVEWPSTGQDRLVIRFDRPLDRVLLGRYLRVTDAGGYPVPGRTGLDPESRVWTFTPASLGTELQVHVDARLEDLAGNSVRRIFDRDLDSRADDGIDADEVVLRSYLPGP